MAEVVSRIFLLCPAVARTSDTVEAPTSTPALVFVNKRCDPITMQEISDETGDDVIHITNMSDSGPADTAAHAGADAIADTEDVGVAVEETEQ